MSQLSGIYCIVYLGMRALNFAEPIVNPRIAHAMGPYNQFATPQDGRDTSKSGHASCL